MTKHFAAIADAIRDQEAAQRQAHRHALLHADDIDGWWATLRTTESMHRLLNRWLHTNVAHAIDACPRLMAFWKSSMEAESEPGLELVEHLGAWFEPLDDDHKARMLGGTLVGAHEQEFYRGVQGNAEFFKRLSPAWIGPPGSALRGAMVARGWQPKHLFVMVSYGLNRPAAQRWASWVPYTESLLVLNHVFQRDWKRSIGTYLLPKERLAPPWANPVDIAVAQALVEVHDVGGSYALRPHSGVAPLDPQEALALRAMVLVHRDLDQLQVFQEALREGRLPGDAPMESFAPQQGFGV